MSDILVLSTLVGYWSHNETYTHRSLGNYLTMAVKTLPGYRNLLPQAPGEHRRSLMVE